MPPEETVSNSLLDKPLCQLTEADISQLTREDCRRYLKQKGMRKPSWNKSQAIQQVISLKALLDTTPGNDAGIRKKLHIPRADTHVQRGKNTVGEPSEPAKETVPAGRNQLDKPDFYGHRTAPLVTAVDHSAPSRIIGSANTPVGQMTIFYCGKVNVYDDVSADKAKTIMCLASSPLCVPSETPSTDTVATRHSAHFLQDANTKLCPATDTVPTIQTGWCFSVHRSPDCPRWDFSAAIRNGTEDCLVAIYQGRRKYQEDRIICYPRVIVPILGEDVLNEASVGIAAVFDGHGSKGASVMAFRKFLDYFLLNVVFSTYKNLLSHSKEHEEVGQYSLKIKVDDESTHGSLEKALLRTILDIDSALKNGYISGSTATIVLWMNWKTLVGNLGDSKALLCSRTHFDEDNEGLTSTDNCSLNLCNLVTGFQAEELTRDHHPDRDDEKARIEAAGGFVSVVGVPQVNDGLAVSRSIGDIYFKRYGVAAEPEVTGWRRLSTEDQYVVIASDGIFEEASPRDVCDILRKRHAKVDKTSTCSSFCPSSSSSLADCIVYKAFSKGSNNHLSVIEFP
ncbi:unnamed protein product [Withania somnifera]